MSAPNYTTEDLTASYRLSYSSQSSFVLPELTGVPPEAFPPDDDCSYQQGSGLGPER